MYKFPLRLIVTWPGQNIKIVHALLTSVDIHQVITQEALCYTHDISLVCSVGLNHVLLLKVFFCEFVL